MAGDARWIAVLALQSLGCSPELLTVEIDPGDARSMVVAYLEPGGALGEVFALDLEGSKGPLTLPRRPGAEVYALTYSCPRSSLGLGALSPPRRPGGVRLRTPRHVWHGSATGLSPADWQAATELPAALSALELEGVAPNPCRSFHLESQTMPMISSIALLGQDRARVVVNARTRLNVHAFGSWVPEVVLRPSAPVYAGAALSDGLGNAYFLSTKGTFWRVTPALELSLSSTRTGTLDDFSRYSDSRAAGPTDGDASGDIFFVTEAGRIDHFDGRAWTFIRSDPPVASQRVGALWLRPQSALLVGSLASDIVIVEDGVQHREAVIPQNRREDLDGAAWIPALGGPVVYSSEGAIWSRLPDGSYRELGLEAALGWRIEAMAPAERGFLFANRGSSGTIPPLTESVIILHDVELGTCAESIPTPYTRVHALLPAGEGRWVIYGNRTTTTGSVTPYLGFLTSSSPVERCD